MQERRVNRPERYRREAIKARRAAMNMHDPKLRRELVVLAQSYERMATMAERYWGKPRTRLPPRNAAD